MYEAWLLGFMPHHIHAAVMQVLESEFDGDILADMLLQQ